MSPSQDQYRTFDALGCHVHVATSDPAELRPAVAVAERLLGGVDATCSRFRRDSDLSRVNAAAGRWVPVAPLLLAAVRVALAAAHESDGLVDPCLGARLVYLGYDADFGVVRLRHDAPGHQLRPHPTGAWREVEIDDAAIRIPTGVALDLGATAKAWAADLVALSIVHGLGGGVVVSIGGDVRVVSDERVPAWPVSVTEKPGGEQGSTVWIDSGGVATSTTVVRRWRAGGTERHHLLDPRSGLPVDGPWRTVTATGPTCVAANVATTAALVLGAQAPAWLEARGVDARLVRKDGRLTRTGNWPVEGADR